ncbi:MAG: site-2 protease family protein [Myxococcota bacterium]
MDAMPPPPATSTNALWKPAVALLLSPLLALLWIRAFALVPLGVLHSLAHGIAAWALGVGVRPQLGFGPVVWRLTRLDLGVLPGTSVHLDPGAPRTRQLGVLAAGPLATLVLGGLVPIALFAMARLSEPVVAPVIGGVSVEGPAALAGLRAGDRVRSVDGRVTGSWDEAAPALVEGGRVELERDGATVRLDVPALGERPGLWSERAAPVVAVDPGGAWARSGVRSGDRVLALDGVAVDTWSDAFLQAPGATSVRLSRDGEVLELPLEAGLAGIEHADRLLGRVLPGSAAERGGLRGGDRVLTVSGHRVRDWDELGRTVREAPDGPLLLEIDREGTRLELWVEPDVVRIDGTAARVLGLERHPDLFLPAETAPPPSPARAVSLAMGDLASALVPLQRMAAMRVEAVRGPVVVSRATAGPASLWRWIATMVANGSALLLLYNLLPLPGSDLLAGLLLLRRAR